MAAIDRRIHALGMRAIIIPVPRKAALHADELPGTVRSRPEVDRAVVRDLEERGIEVVDLIADSRSQTEIVSFRDEVEAREKAAEREQWVEST